MPQEINTRAGDASGEIHGGGVSASMNNVRITRACYYIFLLLHFGDRDQRSIDQ